MIVAVGWVLRLLTLEPREAVAVAAALERADAAELLRYCRSESGGCRRVGMHARARPDVRRRPGLAAWAKAVRAGYLRPGDPPDGCPHHAQSDDPERWGVRGPLGLVAAYHLRLLAPCAAPEALDVPLLAAVVAARHLRALRRMVPPHVVPLAWQVGVGAARRKMALDHVAPK